MFRLCSTCGDCVVQRLSKLFAGFPHPHLSMWPLTKFLSVLFRSQQSSTTFSVLQTHKSTPSVEAPHTEEIGLKMMATANFPTTFHRSPRTYQTRFLGSPQNFEQVSTWVNGVPVTQKNSRWNRKSENLNFLVSSTLWVDSLDVLWSRKPYSCETFVCMKVE